LKSIAIQQRSIIMKTIHLINFFTILTLWLTACSFSTAAEAIPTVPPEPTVASAKPFRVAVIMPSAVNDLAFSQSMYDALLSVQKDMGGPEKMDFVYSQDMFVLDDATTALRVYASRGYDFVIAHGSQYGPSVQEVAQEFPKTSFAWGTTADTFNLPNVFAYQAAAQEGGYVNGVLAATLTKNKMIGIIGPLEVGDAKMYVEGFKAGVAATDPEIQMNVNYIGSFSDVVKASDVATHYISQGVDTMTGTAQMVVGATNKAKESKVLWFGTQSNQSSLSPETAVASQVYHWEVVLKEMIAKIHSGTLGGETYTINLANGGEMIEYNPNFVLPAGAKALSDATVQKISNGSVTVTVP
jgi:basic membrane lipoprotein Med (substrate-binding protein (PBP1-ABC) superfamily)